MSISATDLKLYLTGAAADGLSQADPNASLGNYRSSNAFVGNTLHNLFDQVSGDEASAGDVEYRCICIKNEHATLTLQGAKVWLSATTPSVDTTIEIGIDPPDIAQTGATDTIADEGTAPTTPVFSTPTNKASALLIGDMVPGAIYFIWIKRIVGAAASAYDNDSCVVMIEGDTAA